jgi:hypothetical protein
MKRRCCVCGDEKPVSHFSRRGESGYQSRCKLCDNRPRRGPARLPTQVVLAEGATHDEIAAVLGVTRSRVQQIEAQALRKLRLVADRMKVRP